MYGKALAGLINKIIIIEDRIMLEKLMIMLVSIYLFFFNFFNTQ